MKSVRRVINNLTRNGVGGEEPPTMIDPACLAEPIPLDMTDVLDSYPLAPGSSPIGHLPLELLLRLFHAVLDVTQAPSASEPSVTTDVTSYSPPDLISELFSLTRVRAPFVLASVCRHWRRIALDNATLWTHIVVPSPRYSTLTRSSLLTGPLKRQIRRFTRHWMALLASQIERSRDAPLDVRWFMLDAMLMYPLYGGPNRKLFNLHRIALDVLLPHCARFAKLRMIMNGAVTGDSLVWPLIGQVQPHDSVLPWFLSVTLDMPMLEELVLDFRESHEYLMPTFHFKNSRLKRFCVRGLIAFNTQTQIQIRLSSNLLVRLELGFEGATLQGLLAIIAICASTLEVLQLTLQHSRTSPPDVVPTSVRALILLPRVSYFCLKVKLWPTLEILGHLFATVQMPNLISACLVDIPVSNSVQHNQISPLPNFITYLTSPNLEHLGIDVRRWSRQLDISDARSIAQHFPSLKSLTILEYTYLTNGFLGMMHYAARNVRIRLIGARVVHPVDSLHSFLVPELGTRAMAQRQMAINVRTERNYDTLDTTPGADESEPHETQVVDDAVVVWLQGPRDANLSLSVLPDSTT